MYVPQKNTAECNFVCPLWGHRDMSPRGEIGLSAKGQLAFYEKLFSAERFLAILVDEQLFSAERFLANLHCEKLFSAQRFLEKYNGWELCSASPSAG